MKPADIIAIILTLTVFMAVATVAVRSVIYEQQLSTEAAEIVADVLKVIVGAIIGYLGYKMGK